MRDLATKDEEDDAADGDSVEDKDGRGETNGLDSAEEYDTLQRSSSHNSAPEDDKCAMDAQASTPSGSDEHTVNDSCRTSATIQNGEVLDVSLLHGAAATDKASVEGKTVKNASVVPATTATAALAKATDWWMDRPFALPPPTRSAMQPSSARLPGRTLPLPVTDVLGQPDEVSFSGLAAKSTAMPSTATSEVAPDVLTRSVETINLDRPSPWNSAPTTPAEQHRPAFLAPLQERKAISPTQTEAPVPALAGDMQQEEVQLLAHPQQMPSPLEHMRPLPQPQVQAHCRQHMHRPVAMPMDPNAVVSPVTMPLPRPVLISEFIPHPEVAARIGCQQLHLGAPRILAPGVSPSSPKMPCKQSCSSTMKDELQFEKLEQQQQQQQQPPVVEASKAATEPCAATVSNLREATNQPIILPRPQGAQPEPTHNHTTTETRKPSVKSPKLPPGRMTVLEEQVAALLQEVRIQARSAVTNSK